MKQGRIIKVISNQYTILDGQQQFIAKPRGKMRKGQTPYVGDWVNYEIIDRQCQN